MKWRKLGHVFLPPSADWHVSHAALPVVDPSPDSVTVYFTSRDQNNRSRIGRFDFDPTRPQDPVQPHPDSLIDPGPLGAFDDSGCATASLVSVGVDKYLYYSGWSLGVTVPFYLGIGLAIGDGTKFEKVSRAPILGDRKSTRLNSSH